MNDKKFTQHDMIREAVDAITETNPSEPISYGQINEWIEKKYGPKSKSSITCHILCQSVNAPSRIHYGRNKPRIIDHAGKKDFLFTVAPGMVVKYDPQKHGLWEIRIDPKTEKPIVGKVETLIYEQENVSSTFALESHLRDYLAKNLDSLTIRGKKLELVRME